VVVGEGAPREALVNDIRKEEKIVDIGPATAAAWSTIVEEAPFVVWNGPMGIYEDGFTKGTDVLAAAVAKTHAVVGGGDTIAAVSKVNFDPSKVFLSSGGGAMLEFLESGTLVGLEPLQALRWSVSLRGIKWMCTPCGTSLPTI
jgi:phosphoglycerate kinase